MTVSELRIFALEKAKTLTNNYGPANPHRVLKIDKDEICIPHKFGFIKAARVNKWHNIEEHIHVHITVYRDNNESALEAEEYTLIQNLSTTIYDYWVKYSKKRGFKGFYFVFDTVFSTKKFSKDVYELIKEVLPKSEHKSIELTMNKKIEAQGLLGSWVYLGGFYSSGLQNKILAFVKQKEVIEDFIDKTPGLTLINDDYKAPGLIFSDYNRLEYKNVIMSVDLVPEREMLKVSYYDEHYLMSKSDGKLERIATENNLKEIELKNLQQWIHALNKYMVEE